MMQRLVAGLTGLAIVLPAIIWGGFPAIGIIVGLALLIALDEYAGMATPHHRARGRLLLILGGGLVHLAFGYQPELGLPAAAIAVMLVLLVPMFAQPDVKLAAEESTRLGFGVFYAPLLLAALLWIRRDPDGLALIFLVLAVTWLGDTGAYFAGRFAGKTPLFPRISPKKTREGVVGGVALSMLGACVVQLVGQTRLSWVEILVLGAVLDLAGVLGDLAESMLKRAWGVKDSGWIMPGHGGILDRVDSLLFSAPLLYAWLELRPLWLG